MSISFVAPSCKQRLKRISPELEIQDGHEGGNFTPWTTQDQIISKLQNFAIVDCRLTRGSCIFAV